MRRTLDLLVVNPPARGVYQRSQETSSYPALEPPYFGLLTATFARNRGFSAEILDANLEGLTPEQTAQKVLEANPKLAHIIVQGNQPSSSTQLMGTVGDICRNLSQSGRDVKTLLSGVHPSALPERTLMEERCDYVARGEGYHTATDLLMGKPLPEVSGLWFRQDGKIISGKKDILLMSPDLNREFAKVAWNLVDVAKYRAHDWQGIEGPESRQPYASLYTSFGCPWSCNFCVINTPFDAGGERKHMLRYRDPNIVVDEVQSLVEKGVRKFKFADELFVFRQGSGEGAIENYAKITKEMSRRGLGDDLDIWAYARVDSVDNNRLGLMRKAGINWLILGIEAGSKDVRRDSRKGGFGTEDVFGTVKSIKDSGINVMGNFMFGLPNDTLQTMQETLDMAKKIECERANFYCTMAYPGSKLHSLAQQRVFPLPKGWAPDRALLPEDKGGPGWVGYSQHSYQTWPLPTATLFPEQVLRFRDNALGEFFNDPEYKARMAQKYNPDKVEEFCRVNSQKPRRMLLGD